VVKVTKFNLNFMGREYVAEPERIYRQENEGYRSPPPAVGVRPSIIEKAKTLETSDRYQAFQWIFLNIDNRFSSKSIPKLPGNVRQLLGDASLQKAIKFGGLSFKLKNPSRGGKLGPKTTVEIYINNGRQEELINFLSPSAQVKEGAVEGVH